MGAFKTVPASEMFWFFFHSFYAGQLNVKNIEAENKLLDFSGQKTKVSVTVT